MKVEKRWRSVQGSVKDQEEAADPNTPIDRLLYFLQSRKVTNAALTAARQPKINLNDLKEHCFRMSRSDH